MNLVMENGKVLNRAEVFVKLCELDPSLMEKIRISDLVDFIDSRLEGQMCDCVRGGVFEILPLTDSMVQDGGKRYMKCVQCGGYSHL